MNTFKTVLERVNIKNQDLQTENDELHKELFFLKKEFTVLKNANNKVQ
jgi:hypothetical protein